MRRPALSILVVALSTACGPQTDPQQLEPLNQELSATPYDQAMANRSHFAPLCDDRGYPLVGNIVSKTSGTTASTFCAALREPSRS